MKVSLLAVMMIFSSMTFAKDSLWLLCKSDNLVLNVHEHRAGADERAMELHLIYGSHVATGTSMYESSSDVVLGGTNVSFVGTAKVDFVSSTATVDGQISLFGFAKKITNKLRCSEIPNVKDL